MEDTWFSRDLPVLEEITRQVDGESELADQQAIEAATGLDRQTVLVSVKALDDAGLLVRASRSGGWCVLGVTDEARRRVGQWPTPENMAERIVAALEERADNEPDETKRGWLKRITGETGQASRQLAVDIMGSAIKQQMGM